MAEISRKFKILFCTLKSLFGRKVEANGRYDRQILNIKVEGNGRYDRQLEVTSDDVIDTKY